MIDWNGKYLVYGLIDPRTLLIRYVGLSTHGMRRPRSHRNPHQLKHRRHLHNWIRGLLALNLDYTVAVLETTATRDALADAERFWIAYGRACGWPLTNLTDGGDGARGFTHSAEARAKIGAASRGKQISPEVRARIAATLTGRSRPPEARANMSAAHKGIPLSAATRARMSESGKKAWQKRRLAR